MNLLYPVDCRYILGFTQHIDLLIQSYCFDVGVVFQFLYVAAFGFYRYGVESLQVFLDPFIFGSLFCLAFSLFILFSWPLVSLTTSLLYY